ncbi:MAG: FAD-binding domain-containing protein [Eudoraea sp.]|uniref:FAD-binding domain-containing protein n=1 Tax=Eudoraea sp. TaxID=1979955 RepID=UPI003C781674
MELFDHKPHVFPTSYDEILQRIRFVDPIRYGTTRNYINGAVTYLSPYISRGFITTKEILTDVLNKGYKPAQIEKFIQELAWRDYWQQIWIAKGDSINTDLKHPQYPVDNKEIARAIVDGKTGITAIDKGIALFYESGYLHNHLRMYIASISCNVAQSHWKLPAKWMYYHLLDADWASNALSWQWTAGANSNKEYYANQDNINKYCFTDQKDTFLDISYDGFSNLNIPEILSDTFSLSLTTPLPASTPISINEALPACIYNIYNLDPLWKKNMDVNRILLLEPSHFKQYPISQKTIDFMLKLSKDNIDDIQIFVGEFRELVNQHTFKKIYYKEHPLNRHYKGTEESRDWMFETNGYYPSFFAFWKKCRRELNY